MNLIEAPFELPPDAAEVFAKIVETRRSVRLFDGTPVPEKVIRYALELALRAPNSSNLQPWEFYWVRSAPVKEELIKACMTQAAAATGAELIVCVARIDTWRRARQDMLAQMETFATQGVRIPKPAIRYYTKIVPLMYSQGFLNLFGYFKRAFSFGSSLIRPSTRGPTSRSEMKTWATKSAALGCAHLMLAIRAQGFDSCPMEGIDSRRVRKLLRLPRSAQVVMTLAIGKRRANGVTLPHIRGSADWFVKEI